MRITDIRPPEDVARLLHHVATPRPTLQQSGEWQHRLKDGRVIDVAITSHTLSFHHREAVLVVAQDITDRKRAEAQVQHQLATLTALYEGAQRISQGLDLRQLTSEVVLMRCRPTASDAAGELCAGLVHPGTTTQAIQKLIT
jgi:hypothetical protein